MLTQHHVCEFSHMNLVGKFVPCLSRATVAVKVGARVYWYCGADWEIVERQNRPHKARMVRVH